MADPVVLTVHTDGASRGNPGAAAYAFVIAGPDGTMIEEADCLGRMTNNQAEYTALVRALERALALGPEHRLLVHSDSELMVKQMNGDYRVKNEELRGLYEEAAELARRFRGGVTFRHIRRAHNSRADALCNEALDGKRGRSTPPTAAEPSLSDEAVRLLREAAALEPEAAWERLRQLLQKRGVRLPKD
jgi:ribonuclease HI